MKIFQKFQSPSRQIDPVLQLGFYKKKFVIRLLRGEIFSKNVEKLPFFLKKRISQKSRFSKLEIQNFL